MAEEDAGLRIVTLSSTKIRLHGYLQLLGRVLGVRNLTLSSTTLTLSPYNPPPQASGDGSAERGSRCIIAPSWSNSVAVGPPIRSRDMGCTVGIAAVNSGAGHIPHTRLPGKRLVVRSSDQPHYKDLCVWTSRLHGGDSASTAQVQQRMSILGLRYSECA